MASLNKIIVLMEIVAAVENLRTLRTEVLIRIVWPDKDTFLIVELSDGND